MEDTLLWKKTVNGRQPLIEDDPQLKINLIDNVLFWKHLLIDVDY